MTTAMRLSWVRPVDLIAHEIVQARCEGRDIDDIEARWLAEAGEAGADAPISGVGPVPADPHLTALAAALLDEIAQRPAEPGLAADEPDGWDEIAAATRFPGTAAATGGAAVVPELDRYEGAWAGRAAGCLLGKPVEKIPRRGIEEILRATGRWPLTGYFTAVGLPGEVARRWPWNRRSATTSLVENIDGMPEDDDLNFPMLALAVLERAGREAATGDFAQAWLDNLPAGRVFTAERIAYRNLLSGLKPPETATWCNPFREWIGAAIRGDALGWALPGAPGAAAHLAWQDARLSHTRNGIYGEMFTAAACSAALTSPGVEAVLDAARAVIPPRSRLASAIDLGRQLGSGGRPAEECLDEIHTRYGHLHWVHVLGNACLVAFALTRGRGDFATSICLVVTGGWDTDSDGATVGSICGALTGLRSLPREWIDPLRDRVRSTLPGFDRSPLTGLAARTRELAAALAADAGGPSGTPSAPGPNPAGPRHA